MGLALNNLQRLICHKTQQTQPFTFTGARYSVSLQVEKKLCKCSPLSVNINHIKHTHTSKAMLCTASVCFRNLKLLPTMSAERGGEAIQYIYLE